MAATMTDKPEFPPIDPDGPSGVEDVAVDVADYRLGDTDPDQVSSTIYDRPSDMLTILRVSRDRPVVAAGGRENVFMLIDVETNEVVGMQVEDFLARMVPLEPRFIDALAFAELHGMTRDEVQQIRRRVLSPADRFRSWLARMPRRPNATSVTEQALHDVIRAGSRNAPATGSAQAFGIPFN